MVGSARLSLLRFDTPLSNDAPAGTVNRRVQHVTGVHGLPHCTGYQQQRRSRFPEARLRVSQAGAGTQDVSILGPLAKTVYYEADDR
eukprot:3059789-Pyramimonas_sp.AAC.1